MVEYKLVELSKRANIADYASRFVREMGDHDSSTRAYLDVFVHRMMRKGAKLIMLGENRTRKFIPYAFRSYTVHGAGSFDDVSDVSRLFDQGALYHSPELVIVRVGLAQLARQHAGNPIVTIARGAVAGLVDNPPPLARVDLKRYPPFSAYSHTGAYLVGHHIEVAEQHKGRGFGRALIEKTIADESVELSEGFAPPESVAFWDHMGFQFPGLYSGELTAFARRETTFK